MASEIGESINHNSIDSGDFECNICLDLAQDPIVTLCGHLYCWPCLYKWLRCHSQSQECPVCKALIEEEKLVPLYGRGKAPTDPRSRPVNGVNIPNRPRGQRPETTPILEASTFPDIGISIMGAFVPSATASFNDHSLLSGFGGMLIHGFGDGIVYGAPLGFSGAFFGTGSSGFRHTANPEQQSENILKALLVLIVVVAVLALVWS